MLSNRTTVASSRAPRAVVAMAMAVAVAASAGARADAVGPSFDRSITSAVSAVTTFVGAGGTTAGEVVMLDVAGELELFVDSPSSQLESAVDAYFANANPTGEVGGAQLRVVLAPDESAGALVATLAGIPVDPAPYAAGDLWVVPALASLSGSDYDQVATALVDVAHRQVGTALLDAPGSVMDEVIDDDDPGPLLTLGDRLRQAVPEEQWSSAAVYANRLSLDPSTADDPGAAVSVAAVMAGVTAADDTESGVWTSAAGPPHALALDAPDGTLEVGWPATDDQASAVSEASINTLLSIPGSGVVAWGARTLVPSTDTGGEAEPYLAPARLDDLIRRSLQQSLGWVQFEPNDDILWSELRRVVTSYLRHLYTEGAMMGATADAAFTVRIDETTTGADDIAQGVVDIELRYVLTTQQTRTATITIAAAR